VSRLSSVRDALVRAADAARLAAHAPYSGYRVGAAVLASDGRMFSGGNVENASFGLTICAERSAVCAAVGAGVRRISAVAVVADGPAPPTPCGACLQVLAEFAGPATPVWTASAGGRGLRCRRLGRLLPFVFRFISASPPAAAASRHVCPRRTQSGS